MVFQSKHEPIESTPAWPVCTLKLKDPPNTFLALLISSQQMLALRFKQSHDLRKAQWLEPVPKLVIRRGWETREPPVLAACPSTTPHTSGELLEAETKNTKSSEVYVRTWCHGGRGVLGYRMDPTPANNRGSDTTVLYCYCPVVSEHCHNILLDFLFPAPHPYSASYQWGETTPASVCLQGQERELALHDPQQHIGSSEPLQTWTWA